MDGNGAPVSTSRGFYSGQVMPLGALDEFNQRLVTLTDPAANAVEPNHAGRAELPAWQLEAARQHVGVPGQRVWVAGGGAVAGQLPSADGGGRSTLLRVLGCLLVPDGGHVSIDARTLSHDEDGAPE